METTGNLAIQPASCGLGQGLRAYRQLGSSGGLGLGFGVWGGAARVHNRVLMNTNSEA